MTERRPGARRAHKHSAPRSGSGAFTGLTAVALGTALTGIAWVFLVGAAIDFGVLAVRGMAVAWLFTLGASVGAVVCMVLLLALVGRGLRTLGLLGGHRPRRAGARRRH